MYENDLYFILVCTVVTLNEINQALFERIDSLWQAAKGIVKPTGSSKDHPFISCKDIKLGNKFAVNDT